MNVSVRLSITNVTLLTRKTDDELLATSKTSQNRIQIFRGFGALHCRILLQLQSEIQKLEQELDSQEEQLEFPMKKQHGPQPAVLEEEQMVLTELRKKLSIYGKFCGIPLNKIILVLTHIDDLLLNHEKVQKLGHSGGGFFDSIIKQKPLDERQYGGIYYPNDFISLVSWSWFQQLEYLMTTSFKVFFAPPLAFFSTCVLTGLQRLFQTVETQPTLAVGCSSFYSTKFRIVRTLARLLSLLVAVGVVILPVFIIVFMPMTEFWMSTLILAAILLLSTLTSVLTNAKPQDLFIGIAT
jgi:hypothetical protein